MPALEHGWFLLFPLERRFPDYYSENQCRLLSDLLLDVSLSNPCIRSLDSTFRGSLGPWWVSLSLPFTCDSCCLAGAAGCVATLLHDAAMNPAEGNTASSPLCCSFHAACSALSCHQGAFSSFYF